MKSVRASSPVTPRKKYCGQAAAKIATIILLSFLMKADVVFPRNRPSYCYTVLMNLIILFKIIYATSKDIQRFIIGSGKEGGGLPTDVEDISSAKFI